MPTVSEALGKFLNARQTPANADLIARWSMAMETQVNVAVGDGEPVAGEAFNLQQRNGDLAFDPRPQGRQFRAVLGRLRASLPL